MQSGEKGVNIASMLHILSVVVWVGGMFFAYIVLRPVAARLLEPPQRLPLWAETFGRFFPWVWAAVALILGSGLYMIALMGGFGAVPPSVHAMLTVGLAMTAIFAYVYIVPYARLKQGVAAQDWKAAGAALARIRMLVGLNLSLGLINIVIATIGEMAG